MDGDCLVRKGAWTEEEDSLLRKCIEIYGEGKWHQIPLRAGLNRCRKSCRLRWLNYLRPNIKRGNFSSDEVDLIIRLHNLLGNRWSLIAGRLPGRTANDVKNYWNTHQTKNKSKPKPKPTLVTSKPTKPEGNVVVSRPRPRIFIRHNTAPFFASGDDITATIVPSNEVKKRDDGFSPSFAQAHHLQNSGMDFLREEEMKRFLSDEISTYVAGNNSKGDNDDGDSKNEDQKMTSFWDNDVNESAFDMDIWDVLGYTHDHAVM